MSSAFNNKRGIIGTILFHAFLLIILYILGFTTPLPLPPEEGILVNFGEEVTGFGDIEPEQNDGFKEADKDMEPIEDFQSNEGYNTQNNEEAPEVNTGKKELLTEKEKEKEKQRIEEIERIKKKEIEEQQRRDREEKEKKQKEINKMVANAFSKGKNSDVESSSEGITKGDGNQGNESGSIHSDNYTNINSQGDGGISYSLTGRNPLILPKPEYNYQVEGKVVVEVTVNQNGKVTQAVPGVKNSTTLDDNLLKAAKEAALNAVFDVKTNAPAFQKGTITYLFKLQ